MRGESRVTCCFFGDGAFAEGEFHEAANLAALWGLPVLFVCENNLYAMGTALAREHAQTDLAMRAASYGMAAWAIDGMDVHAVEKAARGAVESIRAGSGPHFLEMRTYRFRAHSMYDPDRYRPKDEIEEWKRHDPVTGLADGMRAAGFLDSGAQEALDHEIMETIDRAVRAAEEAPEEPAEDLLLHVTGRREEVPS